MALTPKQEKFAQCVASGMTRSAAYRVAYDAENSSNPVVWTEACLLYQNPNVSKRISELQLPIEEQVGITLKSHIEDTMIIKQAAFDAEDYGAANKANENIGKLLGYYINKTELTGRGGGPVQHTITREIIDPVNGDDSY